MSLADLWRLFAGRRRVSFYDSQEVMRRAVERNGPMDLTNLSDEALWRIVEEEPNSLRAEAAHRQLEWRVQARRMSKTSDSHLAT